MLKLKETLFFQTLLKQAGKESKRLIWLCLTAGAAQGLTVFAILHGLQSLMKTGHVVFHQFLFFAVSMAVFFLCFRHVMGRVSNIILVAISNWRMRIAVKLRSIDMRSFEKISVSKIQSVLLDNRAIAVEAARMMVIAVSSSTMVVVAVFKMFMISVSGACFMIVLMVTGVLLLIQASKKINVLQVDAIKYNVKFANSLKGIVGGFAELKINRYKTSDLFTQEINPDSEAALVNNNKIEQSYSSGMSFFEMLIFLVLGVSLFVMPGFLNLQGHVVGQLLIIGMFCLSPISSLVLFIPLLAKTEFSLFELKNLEEDIDKAVEENSIEGINNNWQYRAIATPKFNKILIKNLQFKYAEKDAADVFHINIDNFELNKGEMLFIRGGNGSGKTTLMRILAGLYTDYEGDLLVDDVKITQENLESYRNLFAVVFSNFYIFESPLGVPEGNLEKINNILGKMELASKVHLTDEGKFSTTELSAGQRKRLALTCAMLEGRDIYLFDEVAADFDPEFRTYFYRTFLQDLKASGATILAISHDDRFFDVADRIVTMDKGVIVNVK